MPLVGSHRTMLLARFTKRKSLQVGEGIAGRLVQTDAPYIIIDSYDDWKGRSEVYELGIFGCVLEVPLVTPEGIIGVLFVSRDKNQPFNDDDAWILSEFADHVANTLIKTIYFDQVRHITQLLTQVSNLSDRTTTLQTIAKSVQGIS